MANRKILTKTCFKVSSILGIFIGLFIITISTALLFVIFNFLTMIPSDDDFQMANPILLLLVIALTMFGIFVLYNSLFTKYIFYPDRLSFLLISPSPYRIAHIIINRILRSYKDNLIMKRVTLINKKGEKVACIQVFAIDNTLVATLKYQNPKVVEVYKCYKECRNEVLDDPIDPYYGKV
jgi:hypothetical protein